MSRLKSPYVLGQKTVSFTSKGRMFWVKTVYAFLDFRFVIYNLWFQGVPRIKLKIWNLQSEKFFQNIFHPFTFIPTDWHINIYCERCIFHGCFTRCNRIFWLKNEYNGTEFCPLTYFLYIATTLKANSVKTLGNLLLSVLLPLALLAFFVLSCQQEKPCCQPETPLTHALTMADFPTVLWIT